MSDKKHMAGMVVSRLNITDELWVVRIRPEERIDFEPGQYVTVGLPGETGLIERPYSVASSPRESELEFFLEIVHEGKLSPHLCQAPVGGRVYLRREAQGKLLFDGESGHINHFMAATVTGIAPFVSMIRNFVAEAAEGRAFPGRIAVLDGASRSGELAYRNELASYASRHAWFDYIPTISRVWLEPEWSGETGRCEDVLRKHLDRHHFTPRDTTVYLCGNPVMIESVEGILKRAGFTKGPVREESYWQVPSVEFHESATGRLSERDGGLS
jgi:ferredoxin--NADP+ reductase